MPAPNVTSVNPGFNTNLGAATKHYFVIHGTGIADHDPVTMQRTGATGRTQIWTGSIIQTLVANSTYLAEVSRAVAATPLPPAIVTTSSSIVEIRVTITSAADGSTSNPLDMQNADIYDMP